MSAFGERAAAAKARAEARETPPSSRWKERCGLAAGILALAALWVAPLPLERNARHALAIMALMMIFWATEVTVHAVTGLIGCYLFWALGVAGFSTAFGGFVSATPWFVFTALLLGTMASKSGLARRLAYLILSRTGDSYAAILFSVIVITFVFNIIIPSALARVAILAVIALGLAEAFGVAPENNAGRGWFLALTYLSIVWDKMMLSGAGAILARGLSEQAGGRQIYWSHWFLAFLPADLLLLLLAWLATLWLFPQKRLLPAGSDSLKQKFQELGPWTKPEKKAGLILALLICLWMTDSLHHIPPEVVCIGIGLAVFLPGIRALTPDDLRRFNVTAVLFTGSALSLAAVLSKTHATDFLARYMFSWLEPLLGSSFHTILGLYWGCFTYHLFMPNAQSLLGTTLPVLLNFASRHGLNGLAVAMIWTAASGPSIFLYQSGIIILAYSYGYFRARDFLKYGLVLTAIEFVVLAALFLSVWPFIGLSIHAR